MNKSGVNFKIFPKEKYDELFKEIYQLPDTLSPEEITKEIQKRLEFAIVWAQEWKKENLESLTFY